ncbi:universal stress protein [Thermodesulfobacteriota bacterium]
MSEIKKIMAAIALSPYAQAILEYSAKMALDLDAQLFIVNIINVRDVEAISSIESMGYKVDTDDYIRGMKEERRAQLDEILEHITFPKEKMRTIFKVGNPFDSLMSVVTNEGIDLIIIGRKGPSALEHILLGSVAEKMVRHSTIPVLVYRKT